MSTDKHICCRKSTVTHYEAGPNIASVGRYQKGGLTEVENLVFAMFDFPTTQGTVDSALDAVSGGS